MPEKATVERARKDAREGKSPSTQAGEFVREEIHHVREGKHGARSTKQAIAIGLSKARRAGVKLPRPKRGTASARTRRQAARDTAKGRAGTKRPSIARSQQGVTARATRSCDEASARIARSNCRSAPISGAAIRVCTKGGQDERTRRPLSGREEGGAHARPTLIICRVGCP